MDTEYKLFEFDPDDLEFDKRHFEAGCGRCSQVWFGYHKVLKRSVAVKLYKVTGGSNEKQLLENILRREMKLLWEADRENIVHVLGWLKLDFAYGIVMEYCQRGNLKILLLDSRIQLKVALRIRLLLNISKAMASLHSLPDFTQRDLKPENILVTNTLNFKLRVLSSTQLTGISGSPAATSKEAPQDTALYYVAPERLNDPTMKPNRALDIYAFAIIMHMVLTREMPYPAGCQQVLFDAIKQGSRPNCQTLEKWKETLDENNRSIINELEQLMKDCWAQDPSARPSMIEVVCILQKILDKQRTSVVMQQAVDAVRQMEETYSYPTDLDQTVSMRHIWKIKSSDKDLKENSTKYEDFNNDVSEITPEKSAQQHETVQQQGADHGQAMSPNKHKHLQILNVAALTLESENSEQKGDEIDSNALIQSYVEFLKKRNFSAANGAKILLLEIFQRLNKRPEEIEEAGNYARKEGKYLESLLYCELALDFYVSQSNSKLGATNIRNCLWQFKESSKGLLQVSLWRRFSGLTQRNEAIVRDYVIPLMEKTRLKISSFTCIDKETACLCEIRCLGDIQYTYGLIGDYSTSEEILKRGLAMLRKQFGANVTKYEIFALLSYNLAFICKDTNRFNESMQFFQQAVEGYISAEDITEEKRRADIEDSKNNLQIVKTKLSQP